MAAGIVNGQERLKRIKAQEAATGKASSTSKKSQSKKQPKKQK